MKLIVSDDNNYEIANSYISKEDLKLYDIKIDDVYLIEASYLLDGMFLYDGNKTSENQNLEFPRGGLKVVPEKVKIATIKILKNFIDNEDERYISSKNVGNLKISYFEKNKNFIREVEILLGSLIKRFFEWG